MKDEHGKTFFLIAEDFFGVEKDYEKLFKKEEDKSKKIAVVVGHTINAKGYFSKLMNIAEWDFFFNKVSNLPTDKYQMFLHNENIKSYTQRQVDMAKRTEGYGLTVEMHFDSFEKESAHGCHAMYYCTNKKMRDLAEVFSTQNEHHNVIKARNNVAVTQRSQRGGGFIFEQKGDCLLLEWGFGSNKEDSRLMNSDFFNIQYVLDDLWAGLNG